MQLANFFELPLSPQISSFQINQMSGDKVIGTAGPFIPASLHHPKLYSISNSSDFGDFSRKEDPKGTIIAPLKRYNIAGAVPIAARAHA